MILFGLCAIAYLSPEGPAFLPSEHDELPPGIAFMVGFNFDINDRGSFRLVR